MPEVNEFSSEFQSAAANIESALGSLAKKSLGEDNPLFEEGVLETQTPAGEQGKTEVPIVNSTDSPEGQGQAGEEQGGESGSEKHGDAQQKPEGTGSDQEFEIDSPITGKVKIGDKKEETPAPVVSFKELADVEKFIKEGNFGIDLQSLPAELPKLFKLKADFVTQSEELLNLKTVMEKMPTELYDGIVAWSNGQDFRAAVHKTEPLDLQKKFDDYEATKMVGHYFPEKLTAEDWAEYNDKDGDAAVKEKVKSFIDLSNAKFELDQEKFLTQKRSHEEKATAAVAQRQQSFDTSRTKAFEEFKGAGLPVDESYVSQIDKEMIDDRQILSLFKNPDGTFKDGAHRNYMMAKDGFSLVSQFTNAAVKKVASEVRAEVLDRTSGTAAIKKTGDGSADALVDSTKKVDDFVSRVMPKVAKETY